MADRNVIPVQRMGFQLEELDGETLLYRHSLKKLVYLNESAASVWKLCDGTRTVQDICALLSQAYPEVGESIGIDIDDAISGLVREGALRMSDQPGEAEPVVRGDAGES